MLKMTTKRNKGHKIIHTTTVCHISDGINEYTRWCKTKDKTKYPNGNQEKSKSG